MIEAPSKVQRPAMTRVLEKATYKVDQKKVATGKQQSLVWLLTFNSEAVSFQFLVPFSFYTDSSFQNAIDLHDEKL